MILFIDALTVGDRLIVLEAMTSQDWRSKFSSSILLGIRPEGWTVPEGLAMKHADLERHGVRAIVALTLLSDLGATASGVVVHGRDRVMAAITRERQIAKRDAAWIRPGPEIACTARAAAPIVKVPNPKDTRDDAYLLPSLKQCRDHFNISAGGVDAVAALYSRLVALGAMREA